MGRGFDPGGIRNIPYAPLAHGRPSSAERAARRTPKSREADPKRKSFSVSGGNSMPFPDVTRHRPLFF